MRSTRLPTPLQASPPPPVPAAHAAHAAAAAAATAQALAAEEAPDTTHDHPDDDGGYGTDTTELYEPLQEELLDDAPPQTDESSQLRLLELEQEAAQLRLEVHNLQTELTRQRRLRNQERNLNQLATGPYWISRTRC